LNHVWLEGDNKNKSFDEYFFYFTKDEIIKMVKERATQYYEINYGKHFD
jgi:hypothetical protein